MVKVLFVCLGNICRSPMAEAVFKKMINDENLSDQIFVDSAATSDWEIGNPVHIGTKKRLEKENISVSGMYARQLCDEDLEFDYIIGMDDSNISDIRNFIADKKSGEVKKLLQYAGDESCIADPWYTGDFDKTFDDVEKGCKALLEKIKENL